jgi:hypothetical protein
MPRQQPHTPLSEPRRRELFLALVEAQDRGEGVTQSRKVIADRFGVSVSEVREVEQEGMDNDWPPL